ncbi:methyltransferase domain-containing protein [Actinocrispum sp. NPDC049592]|uniref:methyltransferase domain-containing protein n=1 Tax=Actinocrispum sp. NPDC049592 TaxID=3154835 RepID=UPI0034168EE0
MDNDAKPYLLSNSQPQAARRFEALSELFDPWTFHHIEALGIGPAWHCWEIGAGSPTVPKWLAERTAYTLATDIDTSLLTGEFTPGPANSAARDAVGAKVAQSGAVEWEGAAGGSAVGRSEAGGSAAGGSAAAGSAVGGSAVGGSAVGGSAVGGSAVGGSAAGGSEGSGSVVAGSEAAGSAVGGSAVGGSEGSGSAVGGDGVGGVFEVRRHDVGVDGSPGEFDFVHARLVLVHVPGRVEALATMVRSLRPGGWLLVEEADPALQPKVCVDEFGPEQRLANKLKDGFRVLMAGRGVDLAYGRTLPRLLRAAGLTEVGADAYFPVTSPACDLLEEATVLQIRHRLVAAGLATDAEIDQHLGNVRAGRLDLTISPLISAWGRKPREGG